MPAYWIARSRILDPVEYKRYTDLVPDIVASHKGEILARGSRYETLEGTQTFHRFVLIEFPTFDDAVRCFNSPEYAAAAEFRRAGAGIAEVTIVESGDATGL